MYNYPDCIELLIEALRRLPGIGRRGAERMAMQLAAWEPDKLRELSGVFANLPERLARCPECGALLDKGDKCKICDDERRDRSVICVVADFNQLRSIEDSGNFRGLYHVLGGKISPLDEQMGENLTIEELRHRLAKGDIKELIIALGSDVEARATGIYLAELFKKQNLRISQLALGLPAGANLSYADAATISAALSGRTEL